MSKTVSNIYSPKDGKRSPSFCFNVREGDIVRIQKCSTREEAELLREAELSQSRASANRSFRRGAG